MPNPALTAVLPLPNGFQDNPTRGSKLRSVGFANNGLPRWGLASVILRSVLSRLRLVLAGMRLVLHRARLAFLDLAKHGFDVNHRCAVNRFDRTDSETIL